MMVSRKYNKGRILSGQILIFEEWLEVNLMNALWNCC